MTGDRPGAAGPARRTLRQKIAAWFTALYHHHPGLVVIGGPMLLLTALILLFGLVTDNTPKPCPPGKVCDFVR
ncbi:hypothetical protein GCM10020229_82360 [Kitasatospora albolonga]|uniref:hypothetical protein n=1 Tax=Kitasatospora albolonga TaxID=68173 RepID=UPI0031EF722F